jgi:molybdopterin-containing oxidoreductase family membrane subunit
MNIFPGKEVLESTMMDGMIAPYTPTFAELALGLAGVMVAMIMVAVASRMLKVLPDSLEDPTEQH